MNDFAAFLAADLTPRNAPTQYAVRYRREGCDEQWVYPLSQEDADTAQMDLLMFDNIVTAEIVPLPRGSHGHR